MFVFLHSSGKILHGILTSLWVCQNIYSKRILKSGDFKVYLQFCFIKIVLSGSVQKRKCKNNEGNDRLSQEGKRHFGRFGVRGKREQISQLPSKSKMLLGGELNRNFLQLVNLKIMPQMKHWNQPRKFRVWPEPQDFMGAVHKQ